MIMQKDDKHFKLAKEIVSKWPKWKQEACAKALNTDRFGQPIHKR